MTTTYYLLLLLCLTSWLLSSTLILAAPSSSVKEAATTTTVWREVRPTQLQLDVDPELQDKELLNKSTPRRLIWKGRYDEQMTWLPDPPKKHKNRILPHPLRTDLWTLNVAWIGGRERRQHRHHFTKTCQVEFHPNGYVQCQTGTGDVLGIGEWELLPWGLHFTITEGMYDYVFTACVHLNHFGAQPKLMQGSIVRYCHKNDGQEDPMIDDLFVKSKRKWFRPVVGSFSGMGIGDDTADLAYSNRGVGLTQ